MFKTEELYNIISTIVYFDELGITFKTEELYYIISTIVYFEELGITASTTSLSTTTWQATSPRGRLQLLHPG